MKQKLKWCSLKMLGSATSHRMQTALRNWKRQWNQFSLEALPILFLDFWPPELWDNQFVLSETTKFAVICQNSDKKWTHHVSRVWRTGFLKYFNSSHFWFDTNTKRYWVCIIWKRGYRRKSTFARSQFPCRHSFSLCFLFIQYLAESWERQHQRLLAICYSKLNIPVFPTQV